MPRLFRFITCLLLYQLYLTCASSVHLKVLSLLCIFPNCSFQFVIYHRVLLLSVYVRLFHVLIHSPDDRLISIF